MVRYVDKEAVRQDRFDNYGILSRLFRVEVDERLLDDLVAAETVEPDGGPDFNEGYRRMRAFVDSIEDVAKERSRLAVDYSLVFLGYGVNPAEKTDSARLNAAYPYESIYTTGKKTLMGKSCEGVSALYHAEAFRPNRNRILADDHMACELEFMQYLVGCEFEAARSMDSEETDNVRAKEKSFIDQHPMKWVTAFRKEIEVRSETEFYKALAQMTEGWLADEASRLGGAMNEDMGPDGRGWKSEVVEYDLGWARPGQSVVFNTTRSVYVSVMDEENYKMFKCDAEGYTAYRGQIQSSPFRFRIPSEGHWHAVLDPRTYSGIAEFSVRLMDDTVLDR